jgi:myo-inositol-1(or 4)-monophosphatase
MTDATDPGIDARYRFAQELARRAGARALEHWRTRDRLVAELKGAQDWVSEADRDVERLLREAIAAAFPGDRFLGEETAAAFAGPVDRCWVIDPIDGTHNFLRGVPYWNVAIAYVDNGKARVAATYDAPGDELYHAVQGGGAWCDTRDGTLRLRTSATTSLSRAFVALGHHDRAPSEAYLAIRRRMMERSVAMRNLGSGALQIAQVARGRFDGFIELALSIWDAIGGLLLVEEAGGYAAPFEPATPTARAPCLACAPGIATELRALAGL